MAFQYASTPHRAFQYLDFGVPTTVTWQERTYYKTTSKTHNPFLLSKGEERRKPYLFFSKSQKNSMVRYNTISVYFLSLSRKKGAPAD